MNISRRFLNQSLEEPSLPAMRTQVAAVEEPSTTGLD